MTLTRRRRSKLFALRNSIGGAHLRGYVVSLGGVLRPKLPVRLLRYPFIVKSSLPAASRSSQDIRRSVGPSGREAEMEAGPDASICDFFCGGC